MANDISKQLVQAMTQYTDDVKKDIAAGMSSISSEAMQRVKSMSPKRTGKYGRGWKVDKTNKDGVIGFTVHQKGSGYRLTHLLEDGHRKRNGKGFVSAQPHIREVERWAEAEAVKMIEKAVK